MERIKLKNIKSISDIDFSKVPLEIESPMGDVVSIVLKDRVAFMDGICQGRFQVITNQDVLSALSELLKYRALGTIEELQNLKRICHD